MINFLNCGKICIWIFTIVFFSNTIDQSEAQIYFQDATSDLGIYYVGDTYGSSWVDFNGDKFPDLFVGHHIDYRKINAPGIPNLFLNNGNGLFNDVSSQVGLGQESFYQRDLHGASWADFDNDGDPDLIILAGGQSGKGEGPNAFLVNNEGFLEEKAVEFGLDYPLGRGRMPLWYDYDNDGLLDLIQSNSPRPDGLGQPTLFRQTPQGFEDVRSITGLEITNSWFAQISDLSLDGKMEILFLAPVPQSIYDTSKIPFKDVIENLGMNKTKQKPDDFVIADFNEDLLPDIFMTISRPNSEQFQIDKLLINTGSGFEDRTSEWNLKNPTACKAVVAGDFDNDMDLDIFLACATWKKDSVFSDKNIPNILL